MNKKAIVTKVKGPIDSEKTLSHFKNKGIDASDVFILPTDNDMNGETVSATLRRNGPILVGIAASATIGFLLTTAIAPIDNQLSLAWFGGIGMLLGAMLGHLLFTALAANIDHQAENFYVVVTIPAESYTNTDETQFMDAAECSYIHNQLHAEQDILSTRMMPAVMG